MMTAGVDAATLAATLRDGAALDLLLRLQRGKPRTIEQIREIAPQGIDLGHALTALESAGLIRIEREGLRIERPEPVIADAVTRSLGATRRRLDDWRDLLRTLEPAASFEGGAGSASNTPDPGSSEVRLRFLAGEAGTLWEHVLGDMHAGIALALPDVSGAEIPLSAWIEAASHAPPPAASRLLIGVRAVNSLSLAPLLDALHRTGVQVRLVSTVPFWLALTSAARGVLSADESHKPLTGMYVTDSPPVAGALYAAFDSWWAKGLRYPLGGTMLEDGLALRAQGMSDDEAAVALGTSTRTLQREFARFMERVGVRSRFELGVWWAKHRSPSTHLDTAADGDAAQEGTR